MLNCLTIGLMLYCDQAPPLLIQPSIAPQPAYQIGQSWTLPPPPPPQTINGTPPIYQVPAWMQGPR